MPFLCLIVAATCFAIAFENPWFGVGVGAALMCVISALGNVYVSVLRNLKGEN